MANPITHVYIAKRVLETLPMQIREEIELYKDAFLFGSAGPDFLFALREVGDKKTELFADTMQYSGTYDVFNALSQYVTSTNNEFVKYYTLGLLCHYVVDLKYHPYVYFLTEEALGKDIPGNQINGIHNLIESAIDTHIITEILKYRTPNDYKPLKTDFKVFMDTRREISRIYTDIVGPVLQIPATKTKIMFSISAFRQILGVVTDTTGLKKKYYSKKEENNTEGKKTRRNLLREPEFYADVDYLNFSRVPYRTIRNRDDGVSVSNAMEILNESIPLCRTYIEKFLGSIGKDKKLDKADFIVNYQGIDTSKKKSIFSFFSFF
jgi:hypothetical protein